MAPPGTAALTAMELERQERIARIKQLMDEIGVLDEAKKLQESVAAEKRRLKKSQKAKRAKRARTPPPVRKSSRIQNKPAVNYAVDYEPIVRSTVKKGVRVRRPSVYNLPAQRAAAEQAERFVEALWAKGRAGFMKAMTKSQVEGGFYSQIPSGLAEYYHPGVKRSLVLFSAEGPLRQPEDRTYCCPGSSTQWPVIFLPHDSAHAWSGGWRGFAIDHELDECDSVVYEVMDNGDLAAAEAEAAAAAAAAQKAQDKQEAAGEEAGPGATAAADGADEAGGEPGSDPGSNGSPGASSGAAAAGGSGSNAAAAGEGEGSCGAASSGQDADADAADGKSEGDSAGEESEDGAQGQKGERSEEAGGTNPPLVYKDLPKDRKYVRVHIFRASQQKEALEQQQEEEEEQVLQAEENTASSTEQQQKAAGTVTTAKQPGAPAAAAADAAVHVLTRKRTSTGKQQKQAAPPTAGRKRSSTQDAPSSSKKAKTQTRPAAAAAAATKGSKDTTKQQPKKASKPTAAASAAGLGVKGAGVKKRVGGKKAALVPQPANPAVLVPPPTEEEVQRDAAGGPFTVECIMAHQEDPSTGADRFLIRWATFGPYWDLWVSREDLDAEPHTYRWHGGKKALPAKFRV